MKSFKYDRLSQLTEAQYFLGTDKSNKYTTSYSYDDMGNMTMNLNQGIDSISYNDIGKPSQIQMIDGGKVEYVYSASGEKLQVRHTFPLTGEREVTDYCGDLGYTKKQLESVRFDGGYMLQMENKKIPFFYVKDYQGNNRVVYNDNGFENQWIDNYPFGGISYSNVHHEQQRFFYYTQRRRPMPSVTTMAAGTNIGSYLGSILGIKVGTTFGAFVGSSFDGVGAVPGAIVGGILGGYMGGTYSEKLATNLINKMYNK